MKTKEWILLVWWLLLGIGIGWIIRPTYDMWQHDRDVARSIQHMEQIPLPARMPNPFDEAQPQLP